jgi:hypothetical protein
MKITIQENSIDLVAETSHERDMLNKLRRVGKVTAGLTDPWASNEDHKVTLSWPKDDWGT